MSLETEYIKRVKKPISSITITKFPAGVKPSIDIPWYGSAYDYTPEIISIETGYGYDQGASTCTITIKTPYDGASPIIFEPMNRVIVRQGWNITDTLTITFFGFVDSVDLSDFPRTQVLKCMDSLKLAQNNYYVLSNKKVYYHEDWTDEYGTLFSAKSESERYAEQIISDLLVDSGIPTTWQDLDQATYLVGSTWVRVVIGNWAVFEIVYMSAMEAIESICNLIGYRIFCSPAGVVTLRWRRPFAGTTPSYTYRKSIPPIDGNLLKVTTIVSDETLRNYVDVRGYLAEGGAEVDRIKSTLYASSSYIPTPPTYRRVEISSEQIDTQNFSDWLVTEVLTDLNRLTYGATASIEGDPRLRVGQTISIEDQYVMTVASTKYFVYDISSRMDMSSYVMDLRLTGGVGTGASSISDARPVAAFGWYIVPGSSLNITVDASASYDPNGEFENLVIVWSSAGFANVSGIAGSGISVTTNTYVVSEPISGAIDYLTVILSVSDGNEVDYITQVIPYSGVA